MALSARTLALLSKPFEGGNGPSHGTIELIFAGAEAEACLPAEGNKLQRVLGGLKALQAETGDPFNRAAEKHLRQVAELNEALDGAHILGVQTMEAARVERLDMAVRSSSFIYWVRDVVPTFPRLAGGVDVSAGYAADLLDAVQAELRFFEGQGERRWKYGKA